MHKTILTAGIALLLAGIAVPGAAYHIEGNPVVDPLTGTSIHTCVQNIPNTMTTHDWCVSTGLLIICEQEDFVGDPTLPPIKKIGDGGLCFMSAGHGETVTDSTVPKEVCESLRDQGAEPDTQTDKAGRSDGWGYSGGSLQGETPNPLCPARPSKDAPNDWYRFNMTGFDGTDVAWTAQAGPAQCDADVHNILNLLHEELLVDELFLYWSDNGHLAGFPNLGNEFLIDPATFGTYDVDIGEEPTVAPCDSTLPGAPMYIVV